MKTWTNIAIATSLMVDTRLGVRLLPTNKVLKEQILNTIDESKDICVDESTGSQLDEVECVKLLMKDILKE